MAGEWVLVTEGGDGQSRAAVAAVRALAADGYRPAVTEYEGLSLAGASRHCARRVPVPLGEADPEGYAKAVRTELESRPYLAVFPGSDAALVALDAPVQHLINKESSARLAVAAGLPVPPSRVFESAEELLAAAHDLEYPIVVKPVVKRYAAARFGSADELEAVAGREGLMVVQPYLRENLRGVVGLMWQGKLVAATHLQYLRVWPAPCGTIASGTTVPPDAELEARLETLLAGYDGVFHVDLAGPYLLDVNPRTHASLPVAIIAGANVVSLYCSLLRGAPVAPVRGRPGLFFRHLEGDLRSILWQVRAREMGPAAALDALRPRRGTVHSFSTWRDLGPTRARLRYVTRRLSPRHR
ncbi:MAG: hypothetical protein E6G06_16295 [Actinobacteria bacterium]|nr:MAG: hypothetical protein E6G06_16295 [Actinomycetota bacterium]